MATTANHVETFKLLNGSDDDSNSASDDVVSLPPPRRKVKTRRKLRPSSTAPSGSGGGSAGSRWAVRVVAGVAVGVALGLLGLLLFTLQRRVDTLEQRLADVEVGSKSTPEELHTIHARLRGLEDMGTGLRENLTQTAADLAVVSSQVQTLITTVDSLRQSIATAPQIETLPKAVASLQESVATMGSKINALEMNTKETKTLTITTSQTVHDHQDQLQRLAVVCNRTDSSFDAGWKEVERFRAIVDQFNASLETEIRRVEADRRHQDNEMDALRNLTLTLSTQIEGLRNACHSGTVDPTCSVNADVTERLGNLSSLYQQLLDKIDNGSHATDLSLQNDRVRLQALHDQFLQVDQRLSLLERKSDSTTPTRMAKQGTSSPPPPSASPSPGGSSAKPSSWGSEDEGRSSGLT